MCEESTPRGPVQQAPVIADDDFYQDGLWRRIYDLSHARCEPAHCLAPGLFRAIKRGERKNAKLDVVYEYGNDRRIEFKGPEPLGADDLRVLQGLTAMAGPYGKPLVALPSNEQDVTLRRSLEAKWDAVSDPAIMVKTTYAQLVKELGLERGGKQYLDIRNCIERLWSVSIISQVGQERKGFRLLSHYHSNTDAGTLVFALNPMIARAIGMPYRTDRITLSGLPPTPTHAFNCPDSVFGYTC